MPTWATAGWHADTRYSRLLTAVGALRRDWPIVCQSALRPTGVQPALLPSWLHSWRLHVRTSTTSLITTLLLRAACRRRRHVCLDRQHDYYSVARTPHVAPLCPVVGPAAAPRAAPTTASKLAERPLHICRLRCLGVGVPASLPVHKSSWFAQLLASFQAAIPNLFISSAWLILAAGVNFIYSHINGQSSCQFCWQLNFNAYALFSCACCYCCCHRRGNVHVHTFVGVMAGLLLMTAAIV